ncbi:hypothetical protein QAD02_019582 [Eretmocerus hayati]|uniref:Uncharacterized protein n=1 Tax=Eretmocerus hayati TaxID=131215 RepID=A0ACC2PPS7_9HYME|nr:hypothetical protein QAD02_019582 [Eretmocerus hayati]
MADSSIGEVNLVPPPQSQHQEFVEGNKQIRGMLTYEEIASKLLSERLLLTALELHTELCEADRELPILRDFFSNPNNFECLNVKPEPLMQMPRSSSQATLDSLDMTRYSEDGGVDERVAVLEFELRKAKENINSLRANLTVVTESEVSTPDKNSEKHNFSEHPIKPHELRALNFLVNEYLMANSYKLTSITFSDENENQDFEDWQDVGLNISRPPELLQVYREFMRSIGCDRPPSHDTAVQTEEIIEDKSKEEELNRLVSEQAEEMELLKQQTVSLEQENSNLQQIIANSNAAVPLEVNSSIMNALNSSSTTPDKFEMLESPPQDVSSPIIVPETEEDDSASMAVSIGETETSERDWTRIHFPRTDFTDGSSTSSNSPSRYLPANFRREVLKHCQNSVPAQVSQIIEEPLREGISRDTLPDIAAQVLPRIAPNVVLNRREEIIPLLLSVIKLQNNPAEREKLLQLLFNLQKRPYEEDRQMILAGLAIIARLEKDPTDNEEVLNLCWEQSQHKHPERRLLAAECCSALAIYTTCGIRNSLMVSMLQQMLLDDKDPVVRVTVVKSLALLVALMDDPDKYFQCEELALTAMDDQSSEVVECASKIFIPILAQWALSLKRLQSHLLTRILTKLRGQLKPSSSPGKESMDSNRAPVLLIVMRYLLPHTIISVVDTEPVRKRMQESLSPQLPHEFTSLFWFPITNPKNFYECDVDMGILLNTFFLNAWDDKTWPELEWLSEKLIPSLFDFVDLVNPAQENVVVELLSYLQSLCLGFGKYISQSKILPVFKSRVDHVESVLQGKTDDQTQINLLFIPAYLAIVSAVDCNEFTNILKYFFVELALCRVDLSCLQIAIVKFCGQDRLQEYVLSALWDGVVHQEPCVKCATASLFDAIVSKISDKLIDTRIAPAVVTLANDNDEIVKAAAVQVLGKFVMRSSVPEVKDKARQSLESILRDPQGVSADLAIPLIATLVNIIPHCPAHFVEDIVAPRLTSIASSMLQGESKADLTIALVEAYSVLVYCSLSDKSVNGAILPGLKYLEVLVNQLVPQHKDTLRILLREIEAKKELPKNMERSPSSNSGLSLASVNVGQGVEDMRQRVSKIFQNKGNSSGMSGIFRKKQ